MPMVVDDLAVYGLTVPLSDVDFWSLTEDWTAAKTTRANESPLVCPPDGLDCDPARRFKDLLDRTGVPSPGCTLLPFGHCLDAAKSQFSLPYTFPYPYDPRNLAGLPHRFTRVFFCPFPDSRPAFRLLTRSLQPRTKNFRRRRAKSCCTTRKNCWRMETGQRQKLQRICMVRRPISCPFAPLTIFSPADHLYR